MVGPSSLAIVCYNYLYMLGTTTTLSMLFQVLGLWLLVHLKEVNINFEINIKKVKKQENKKH